MSNDDLKIASFKKAKLTKFINKDVNRFFYSKESYQLYHKFLKIKIIVPKYIIINKDTYQFNKNIANKLGSFGIVSFYTHIRYNNMHKAIKTMFLDEFNEDCTFIKIPEYEAIIKNELDFYTNLCKLDKYPINIIPVDVLYSISHNRYKYINIVMKYVKYSLNNIIRTLSFYDKQEIIYKLSLTLLDFKKSGFIHNDIKTENILCENIDGDWKLYLIDFNCFNRNIGENIYYGGHTFAYGSPQVILDEEYCYRLYSNDVWSFGIVMFQILNNLKISDYLKPVKKEDTKTNLYSVLLKYICSKGKENKVDVTTCIKVDEDLPIFYIDIMNSCFVFESKERITIEDVLYILNINYI